MVSVITRKLLLADVAQEVKRYVKCKKIMDNHHGVIFAHGKENEGATFHVILPAQQKKK